MAAGMMDYPFGKAALWILVAAVVSGAGVLVSQRQREADRPDLVFLVFAQEHANSYMPAIREFEKQRGVKVRLGKVGLVALQERVRAALEVGAEVPDMVEVGVQLMGGATRGPIEDVGFWDLTE